LLSNSIDWAKIQAVRSKLREAFLGFSPAEYAKFDDSSVQRLVSWFSQQGAVLPYNGKSFIALRLTARQLHEYSRKHGSLEQFLDDLFRAERADAKRLAVALGGGGSIHKLAGLGVPLAAESLKNIGYDLAKPDRHINRAVVCLGMVEFPQWRDRSARNSPTLSRPADPLIVMRAMEAFSREVEQTATLVDNAIWLLCAKSGVWMSNSELIALATK
jgi:hypothetical protein